MDNRITELFSIKYPIIQAGMIWTSGWRLASAVSNAGGLGLIGAGSMDPGLLRDHIQKCKQATQNTYGVNIPLLYSGIDQQIEIIIDEAVPVVFSSAGNPATYTSRLKSNKIKVVHVVSSSAFAIKAEKEGCDAVVAEGFEAGGHNGREETTTMILLPLICSAVKIPVIGAGGIAIGRQMLAAMVLGAEGVQIGSRFVASEEASCHDHFKNAIIEASEGDTMLALKKLTPVRLLRNKFYALVKEAEISGANPQMLLELLGTGRSKKGMFEGDMEEGELEIGQVSALIKNILPAGKIIEDLWKEFNAALRSPLDTH